MSSAVLHKKSHRLGLLFSLLVVAALGLLAQRVWFSPEAREARLSRQSLASLEKEAAHGESDPQVLYYLARRRVEAGDNAGGVQALETLLRQHPRYSKARATLATLLLSENRDEEAVIHLKQAIQDDPGDADAYLGMALLYQRHEAWPLQAQAATAATQASPDRPGGWLLLGDAALRQQDYGKAVESFERAAAVDPKNIQAHAQAALADLSLGRLDPAEQHARKAIQLDPKAPAGYLALGQVLLRRGSGQLPEAEQAFDRAASLGEGTGAANLGLGRVLQAQGKQVEAEQQFRLALRSSPANNDARYALVRSLQAQGKSEEAAVVEREFRKWTRFDQQRVQLNNRIADASSQPKDWFALARLYADMGFWAQARIAVASGLRRAPADPAGLKLLAEIDRNAR